MPSRKPPVPDVLVVSFYQAQCQEPGCNWAGLMRDDLDDACQEAESHETAHDMTVTRA
jgi:hypothetical protein